MIDRSGPKPGSAVRRRPRPPVPSVSVVIPVHGHQPLLAEQLEALAGQTYRGPMEVLVCDNGCDASTLELAGRFVAVVPGLRTVDARARRGASYARNRGAADAAGELIAICDSDDVVASDWLERLVAGAADAEIVGGHVDYEQLNTPTSIAWRTALTGTDLPVQLDFMPFAVGSNVAVWRDVYLAVGGCDEDLIGGRGGDDVDLSWRIMLAGGRLAYAPDAVVHYRLRPDLRSLCRQLYGYGQSSALLYLKFRRFGARRHSPRDAIWFWLHFARRGPRVAPDPVLRGRLLMQAAYHLGELRGAVRYRVMFW